MEKFKNKITKVLNDVGVKEFKSRTLMIVSHDGVDEVKTCILIVECDANIELANIPFVALTDAVKEMQTERGNFFCEHKGESQYGLIFKKVYKSGGSLLFTEGNVTLNDAKELL